MDSVAVTSSVAIAQAGAGKPTPTNNASTSAVTGKTTVKMTAPSAEIHLIVATLVREVKNSVKKVVEVSLRQKLNMRR